MKGLRVGLDVGTSKVCALVAEASRESEPTVIGYGVAPCTGLRKGVVVNIDAAVEAIRAAVGEAEKSAGIKITSAVVGIAGSHIEGLNSHGIVAVRGGEVGVRDVQRVIEAARAIAIPLDRQIIHILPQRFTVDDQADVRDPIGMAGVRIEAHIHVVTAAQTYAQNLIKCSERAGVSVQQLVLEPLSAATAALLADEQELGVALVDIGGGATGVVVMLRGAVMHTAVLPIGGNHLTADLAAGLRTPTAEAERLKIAYGVATNHVVKSDEVVQVPGVGGREPRAIPRRLLGEILGPRMEEIFALVQRHLIRSGVTDSLASGLVLVGGSSLLQGTQELAERVFNVPIRHGLPVNLKGMPEELMKPMYATAAGLVLHSNAENAGANGADRRRRWEKMRSRVSGWVRDFF
jgi:cell division protein FtsA